MAQGAVAILPANGATLLTPEELHEIRECQKICAFRDAVISGTHPRVKLPPRPVNVSKSSGAGRDVSSPAISKPSTPATGIAINGHIGVSAAPYPRPPAYSVESQGTPFSSKSTKSEINPILLEKSDDLIKAEIQLQRQRLERALREQIEQQRVVQKASYQSSESLPSFDLTEVLTKALAIVHPTADAEVAPSVGAASDSFDENTFYSSQHDTPGLSSSPHSGSQKEPGEVLSQGEVSASGRSGESSSSQNHVHRSEKVATGAAIPNNLSDLAAQSQHPRPSVQNDLETFHSHASSANPSQTPRDDGNPSRQAHDSEQDVVKDTTRELLQQAFNHDLPSPLVRARDLVSVAPQLARESPLALPKDASIPQQVRRDEPAPAQVATLREKVSENSSTDSSPKGTKLSERKKKKEKKNKRKSGGKDAVNTPESPYIKPEPRSPSPFGVTPLPRPLKRQRVSAYESELNYNEPRFGESSRTQEERVEQGPYAERREVGAYGHYGTQSSHVVRRYEPEYRRVTDSQYIIRSPPPAHDPYVPMEIRPARAASHAIVTRDFEEAPRYYREIPPRASVRPEADRNRSRSPIMAPPREPVRVVIDEYGREYIEPAPIRHSMAPPPRREIIYERAPLRAVSGRPPVETFEENGVMYRRASPVLVGPRRLVTYSEHDHEYRQYRQREYSSRPMAPPGEEYIRQREYSVRPTMTLPPDDHVRQREYSVRPMGPPGLPVDDQIPMRAPLRREVVPYEEGPREYIRAATARPEPVRYELPREYIRAPSVRSDVPGREFTGSVRPDGRREVREYSVRPLEAPRREYIVEGDRHYEDGRRTREISYEGRGLDVVYR